MANAGLLLPITPADRLDLGELANERLDLGASATSCSRSSPRPLPAETALTTLDLGELANERLDLGAKPGRANVGDKLLTLVSSALAGGDCTDDADVSPRPRKPSACALATPLASWNMQGLRTR